MCTNDAAASFMAARTSVSIRLPPNLVSVAAALITGFTPRSS